MIYWFIGQPGSGKTTLAKEWRELIQDDCDGCIHLDGDDLRKIFGSGYAPAQLTKEWRIEQTRILQRFAEYLTDQGITVIISTVNPYREVREEFKKSYGDLQEIYVHTDKVRGRESYHVADFEPPLVDFWDIDTTDISVEEALEFLDDNLS